MNSEIIKFYVKTNKYCINSDEKQFWRMTIIERSSVRKVIASEMLEISKDNADSFRKHFKFPDNIRYGNLVNLHLTEGDRIEFFVYKGYLESFLDYVYGIEEAGFYNDLKKLDKDSLNNDPYGKY